MQILEGSQIDETPKVINRSINGLTAESIEFDAKVDEILDRIAYSLTFVEGNGNIYDHIMDI